MLYVTLFSSVIPSILQSVLNVLLIQYIIGSPNFRCDGCNIASEYSLNNEPNIYIYQSMPFLYQMHRIIYRERMQDVFHMNLHVLILIYTLKKAN